MFSHIKTSKENKEVVTKLTNRLNLGAENVIARIALTYSMAQGKKMDLNEMEDSGGKSYSKAVLFGDYLDYYVGLVAVHYNVHTSNTDLPKFIKMHIDNGLKTLKNEMEKDNLDGFDFVVNKIQESIS